MRDVFVLHRPAMPTVRAASLQVVLASHAWARRGHVVRLPIEPVVSTDPAEVLRSLGLAPVPTLHLAVLPRSRTLASVTMRAWAASWLLATRGGEVWVRNWRYAALVAPWLGRRARLIFEAHEVGSASAREAGTEWRSLFAMEQRVLRAASALICNAPGTQRLLTELHGDLPPTVVAHNATSVDRIRRQPRGEGVGYVGSLRDDKDCAILAAAAHRMPWPVTVVGAEPDAALRFGAQHGSQVRLLGPVPYPQVPDVLAQFRVLVLPLGTGLFGTSLTSPLKLWDYLASGVPVVGADTDALRAAAPGQFTPYEPGNVASLVTAIQSVYDDEAARVSAQTRTAVRSWDERAETLDHWLESVFR